MEPRNLLASEPIISEFLASNDGGLRDGFQRAADWIEIHNPSDTSMQLGGYELTDDVEETSRWKFPTLTLEAHGYLVVFASGDVSTDLPDPSGFLHADFKLSRGGEYLALISPAGEIVSEFGTHDQPFPEQLPNVSYGVSPNGDGTTTQGYMETVTPGAPNVPPSEIRAGFVRDTRFSVDRGYFDEPFQLEISTETLETTLRYTTDGTAPSEVNGTIYDRPILIDRTTIVRAAASRDGWIPTPVHTQSFLFLEDVLTQDGAGLPTTWGTFVIGSSEARKGDPVPANYEIDTRVVNDPRYRDTFLSDLQSLPAMSLVLAPDDLWSEASGIYANTTKFGVEWERPGSIELIGTDGRSEFQINAGIRVHGGFSRRPSATAKHNFRLLFKGIYGNSKLEYPLFGEDHVSEFDTIVLRANYNFSWARGNRGGTQTGRDYTLINDRWASLAQREMGGLSPEGNYVHLYVNGLYWGVYNPTERPDDSFQASHQGGEKTDYDVANHEGAVAGNPSAWNDLRDVVMANPLQYDAIRQILDVDGYIDYMILNQFGGNSDWPNNNWYASRNRVEGGKWQFHAWDSEFFFIDLAANNVTNLRATGPGRIYQQLMESEEFRVRYGDRIQMHLFNGGVLTRERNTQRLDALAEMIDRAVVPESARWGDGWMNQVELPRTRDDDWLPRLDVVRDDYFRRRPDHLISLFRRKNLYPEIDAPNFSQHGGPVSGIFPLTISHPEEEARIYFTLDGKDPRDVGGTISDSAILYTGEAILIDQNKTVRARAIHEEEWSAIIEAEFAMGEPAGDFNRDHTVDAADINMLCGQILGGGQDSLFDLNHDQSVDQRDHRALIEQILDTGPGDTDLDGVFDSADLMRAAQAAQYEDGELFNSGWATGDWNCDGEFDSTDLVLAMQTGRFENASHSPALPFTFEPGAELPSPRTIERHLLRRLQRRTDLPSAEVESRHFMDVHESAAIESIFGENDPQPRVLENEAEDRLPTDLVPNDLVSEFAVGPTWFSIR